MSYYYCYQVGLIANVKLHFFTFFTYIFLPAEKHESKMNFF